MSDLKHRSLDQLREDRVATLARIETLKAQAETTTDNPRKLNLLRGTISGQRERIRWIDSYIGKLEGKKK